LKDGELRREGLDCFLDRWDKSHWISPGPQLEKHQGISLQVLRIGNVHVWPRLGATEELKFRVASDADYFHFAIFLGSHAECVADGILIGPELSCRAFADDGHISSVFIVPYGNGSAAHNIDAHHVEILRRDDIQANVKIRGIGWSRCSIDG
jgi:hypothetical protein